MCLQVHPRALLELAWTADGLLLSEKRKCAAANGWSVNITYTRKKSHDNKNIYNASYIPMIP